MHMMINAFLLEIYIDRQQGNFGFYIMNKKWKYISAAFLIDSFDILKWHHQLSYNGITRHKYFALTV